MTSDIKKRFLFTVASIIVFIETIIVDLIYMGDKRVVIFLLISIVPFSWLTFAILKSKSIKDNPLIITKPFSCFRGIDKPEEDSLFWSIIIFQMALFFHCIISIAKPDIDTKILSISVLLSWFTIGAFTLLCIKSFRRWKKSKNLQDLLFDWPFKNKSLPNKLE
jgi:hypothetical protein